MVQAELGNPKEAVWESTLGCREGRCIQCGSDAKSPRKNELNTSESIDLIVQCAELGVEVLHQSGGEPTDREDWFDIAKEIKNHSIEYAIISHTLNWTENTEDMLASLNPYAVGISLDGIGKVHDFIRGVKGSYDKVMRHLESLRSKGVTVSAITTVNNRNIAQLDEMYKIVKQAGIFAWQIQVAKPMGRMERSLAIDTVGYNMLVSKIVDFRIREIEAVSNSEKNSTSYLEICPAHCIGYFGKYEDQLRDDAWSGCTAGKKSFGILSNGDIVGCLSVRDAPIEGNVRNKRLKEIWYDPNNFSYTRKFSTDDLKGICAGCDYGKECKGGCQSSSMAHFQEFHHAPYCVSKNIQN